MDVNKATKENIVYHGQIWQDQDDLSNLYCSDCAHGIMDDPDIHVAHFKNVTKEIRDIQENLEEFQADTSIFCWYCDLKLAESTTDSEWMKGFGNAR